jgi:hypothetical protein
MLATRTDFIHHRRPVRLSEIRFSRWNDDLFGA